ncbi:MAG TPA: CHASE2 domain-containing protein [Solirubrobacteraceae bacterium]|nr:CHASE2 domain-containing protein [Solirubrobacteraceae bacterium]
MVALLAAGLASLAHETDLLRRPEQQTIDARYQIRGTQRERTKGIVLVTVDPATFDYFRQRKMPAQWPFPRRYHARVIEQLAGSRARAIAFDVQFTEPTDALDDNALIEAVGRAGDVVLSTTEVGAHGSTDVLGGAEALRAARARVGNTNVTPDSDGVLRNMQYSVEGLRSFGVVAAEVATHRAVPASLFGGPRARVPIDYAGGPGTFSSISYSRVYARQFSPSLFAGKIVVVGSSAPSLQDLHQTPMSSAPMAGPEVVANETATVLAGIPLRYCSSAATVLLIVLLALLVWAGGLRLGTLGVALTGAGLLALWSLASQLVFDAGTVLDYSDPAASLLLSTGGTVLVGMWADSRERQRLRALFAADATAVVDEILGAPAGPRPLEPTAIIAGYRIESAIARGGMGVVYRATQLALNRPVAIKLIATERADEPVFRGRFERESQLAASIEHPNVIPVYEAGDDDGLLFIAMRLVEGTDLAETLARDGPLAPARTARLITQLAGALDAAHAHGLVHRDVKPANVLLTLDEPEHLYLTDFGVAKQVSAEDGMTQAGQWVGTLDYLAPEQIRGEVLGASADIYALACVLFHCLTGNIPFPRDNDAAKLWAHVNALPPAASTRRPGLPKAIDEVIARGMGKDPTARFRTAADLASACARSLGVHEVQATATESPTRERSESSPPTAISE